MKVYIGKEFNQGRCFLTTDSPASSYGIPVFRIESGIPGIITPETDLGPGGFIENIEGDRFPVAEIVKTSVEANVKKYNEEELRAAKKFLAQCPEGPQLEVES